MYQYIYDGKYYSDCSTEFLTNLGLDTETIEGIQQEQLNYNEQIVRQMDRAAVQTLTQSLEAPIYAGGYHWLATLEGMDTVRSYLETGTYCDLTDVTMADVDGIPRKVTYELLKEIQYLYSVRLVELQSELQTWRASDKTVRFTTKAEHEACTGGYTPEQVATFPDYVQALFGDTKEVSQVVMRPEYYTHEDTNGEMVSAQRSVPVFTTVELRHFEQAPTYTPLGTVAVALTEVWGQNKVDEVANSYLTYSKWVAARDWLIWNMDGRTTRNAEPQAPEEITVAKLLRTTRGYDHYVKLQGVEWQGQMLSATADDMFGLASIKPYIAEGMSLPYLFDNGTQIMITPENISDLEAVWMPFRMSFFEDV